MNCFFNLYLQNIVEPDHLMTGIGKGLTDVCFLQVANLDHQKYLDVGIQEQLKRGGVPYQGSVLKANKIAKCNIDKQCLQRKSCDAVFIIAHKAF